MVVIIKIHNYIKRGIEYSKNVSLILKTSNFFMYSVFDRAIKHCFQFHSQRAVTPTVFLPKFIYLLVQTILENFKQG